jgi:RecA-family ATPase
MSIKSVAKTYIENNIVPIPLDKSGDGKGTRINGWQDTYFEANEFHDNNNVGWNLKLSKKVDGDMDSKEATFYAPYFLKPTLTMGLREDNEPPLITHYFYNAEGSNVKDYIKRNFPNGKTIAELRVEGNTVVEPSVAASKLFNNKKIKREFVTSEKNISDSIVADENLINNFNKVCVASVLKTVIASDNMPFVKLTACLKRYCTDWSEEDIYSFIEIVNKGIKNKDGGQLFDWKVIKAKIKTVLKNWDDPKREQSGYYSFAKTAKITPEYSREMFQWIGKVPKEGSENDRKTIIDFEANAMTEDAFQKEVERSFLVDGLICDVGLYVFAGKPKQGKSRAMKDLAYKVRNGGAWFGHTIPETGDVLLLALEDNEDSMNLDIKAMGLQNAPKPTTYVDTKCPSLERGFVESCEMWCEKMKNPKLIIIDTFQKIKPMGSQKTKNANSYEVDYYYLSQLHEFAKKQKICIIYVHHLSQADKAHSWDKIMGSTGHQGVTDAMYMLDREDGGYKGTFKGIGRNIAGFEMNIEWNTDPKHPFTFVYSGDTFEIKTKEHKREIFKAMKQLKEDGENEVKPADVFKVLNLLSIKEKGACKKNMQRMKEKRELKAGEKYGTYRLALDPKFYDDDGNILADPHEPWADGDSGAKVKNSPIDYERDAITKTN